MAAVHSALHQPMLESGSTWSDSRSEESGSGGEEAAVLQVAPTVGRVYVHCTAGLGRAPAVCIAYMYWFLGLELDVAYKRLTDIRPCGPKVCVRGGETPDPFLPQYPPPFPDGTFFARWHSSCLFMLLPLLT